MQRRVLMDSCLGTCMSSLPVPHFQHSCSRRDFLSRTGGGFGAIALAGMIMRNTIILVDQIGQDLRAGLSAEEAIIGSTVRRARPVVLTALAAAFAFVPLALNVFWGPMAIAMIGGLMVATVLTLLFLPALYAWAAVARPPVQDAAGPYPAGTPASSSPAA